jgi:hypothetical protein
MGQSLLQNGLVQRGKVKGTFSQSDFQPWVRRAISPSSRPDREVAIPRNYRAITLLPFPRQIARPKNGRNDVSEAEKHPEQDPAEGSRETIERDLKRQDDKQQRPKENDGGEESNTSGSKR